MDSLAVCFIELFIPRGLDSSFGPVVVDIFKKVLIPLNAKFVIRAQKIMVYRLLMQNNR